MIPGHLDPTGWPNWYNSSQTLINLGKKNVKTWTISILNFKVLSSIQLKMMNKLKLAVYL